ncbi:MAG: transglycosylase SLT domain-containing protein [Gammaproteobacteria bacterium]
MSHFIEAVEDMAIKTITNNNTKSLELKKARPWRRCSMGQHFVKEHIIHVKLSKKHPDGIVKVHEHCANNPSHKEELSFDEIQYITQTYFDALSGPPTAGRLKEYPTSDDFDGLIRGWTKYWDDIFNLDDPLEANLIKALIGSESSFNINPPGGNRNAHGLIQILHNTFLILHDTKGELHDYLVRIPWNKILDPSSNICMGVRWLFQKKKLASIRLKRTASWEEAVIEYKSYWDEVNAGKIPQGLANFRYFYDVLQGG